MARPVKANLHKKQQSQVRREDWQSSATDEKYLIPPPHAVSARYLRVNFVAGELTFSPAHRRPTRCNPHGLINKSAVGRGNLVDASSSITPWSLSSLVVVHDDDDDDVLTICIHVAYAQRNLFVHFLSAKSL